MQDSKIIQGPVHWDDFIEHHSRGGLLLAQPSLSLLMIVEAFALDQVHKVKDWMELKLIAKPSDEQINTWTECKQTFQFAIAQPFVIIQTLNSESTL